MASGGNQDLRNVTGRHSKARLPSMRGPRDLTLGQVGSRGTLRGNIVPNLNLTRKKPTPQVPVDVPKPPEPKKPRERFRGGDRGRGRGRGRGKPPTNGNMGGTIFDQGIAEAPSLPSDDTDVEVVRTEDRKRFYSGLSAASSSNSLGNVVKREAVPSLDDEEGAFRRLLDVSSFIDDGCIKDETPPVVVPLGCEEFAGAKSEKKPVVRQEALDLDLDLDSVDLPSNSGQESSMDTPADNKAKALLLEESLLQMEKSDFTKNVTNERPEFNLSAAEILQDAEKNDKMVVIKVPDVLPLVPIPSAETTKSGEEQTEEGQKAEKVPLTTYFRDYPEGPVGKLRVRKSGKVELVIGENVLEVKPGAPVNVFTEAVSVRLEENGGHMSVVGNVEHKLVVCPSFTDMMGPSQR